MPVASAIACSPIAPFPNVYCLATKSNPAVAIAPAKLPMYTSVQLRSRRAVGVERGDSANFSFLMATPIIAGAGLVEARKLFHEGLDWSVGLGFISAAVFGLVAIAFLIRYVRTRNYVAFAVYRLLVAALVIAVFFARS